MFYVYVYLDPLYPAKYKIENYEFNYTPIYIGKGKGKRRLDHLKKTNNVIFTNKINYWKEHNIEPIIIVLCENLTEKIAWKLEKKLIKTIGRFDLKLGPLLNLTDGGDGPSGRIPWNKGKKTGSYLTEEGRKKISEANLGKILSDDTKEKMRKANLGKILSDDTKEKLRLANLGHEGPHKGETGIWSQERIDEFSKRRKEWWTPEKRLEKSQNLIGKKLTEEHKKNLAIAMELARKPHSDDTKLKMSNARRKYWEQKKEDSIIDDNKFQPI
jgi:hypothetical protein